MGLGGLVCWCWFIAKPDFLEKFRDGHACEGCVGGDHFVFLGGEVGFGVDFDGVCHGVGGGIIANCFKCNATEYECNKKSCVFTFLFHFVSL